MNNLESALEMEDKRLANGLSQGELVSLIHLSGYSVSCFKSGKAGASRKA